jgi:hypothetical protein
MWGSGRIATPFSNSPLQSPGRFTPGEIAPGTHWIAEGIGRHTQEGAPPCKSGMAQEEHSQKRVHEGQCGARNPETTDVREKTSARTGMQQWHKKPSCWRTGTSEQREENRQEYRRTGRRHQQRLESMGNANEVLRKNNGMDFLKGSDDGE